jgi:hypothetical protein
MSIYPVHRVTHLAVAISSWHVWLAVVIAWWIAAPAARAVEVLTVHELVSQCERLDKEPEGTDARYCIRYIQGFIDGAVVTDVRVMLNAEAASRSRSAESFSERAKRTRATTRMEQFRAAQLAGFCLGDPLPLREVVDHIVVDLVALDVDDTAKSPARDAVYASLIQHYPCPDE